MAGLSLEVVCIDSKTPIHDAPSHRDSQKGRPSFSESPRIPLYPRRFVLFGGLRRKPRLDTINSKIPTLRVSGAGLV